MKRTTFLAAAAATMAAPLAARAQPATGDRDLALPTPTGTIAGTLRVAADHPTPVVVIVPGSGPIDRNGNAGPVHAGTYWLLAQALAANGIASVRYDKRGVGASTAAATNDLRFETYANDVAAWLRLLRADPRFTRVELAGHSEGSLLGMLALQRVAGDAFVSLEGAGRPAAAMLREQLRPKLPPPLYAKADAIIASLQAGRTVADTPPELAALFRPSLQPYLISWFRYDPAKEIANVRVPATIVQGTADMQVTMADADALKAAAPAAKLVVVKGMNHMLKIAPDTSSQQAILRGYEDASLPIAPEAVAAVSEPVR